MGAASIFATGCNRTVTVAPAQATIEVGQTVTLQASSTSRRDTSFEWSSADEGVATVDQDGKVTGAGEGTATVKARGISSKAEGSALITVVPASVSEGEGEPEGEPEGEVEGESEGEGEGEGESEGEGENEGEGEREGEEYLSEFSMGVDTSIVPTTEALPPLTEGGPERRLGAVVDERGNQTEFVEDELIIVSDDMDAVQDFVERWNGELLWTIDPTDTDIEMPMMHLVWIDTSLGDPSQLADDVLALDPDARGANWVSSESGLRLISAGAREAVAGLTVGMNWVGRSDGLADRYTAEASTGPNGFNSLGSAYSPNAFHWNHLNKGGNQDIGVTEAWYLLARTRKLSNKVKLAVLDMGFSTTGNNDLPPDWLAISNVPFVNPVNRENLLSCSGGSPCPWHGTNVVGAAMGVPDNNFGGAGPAGPVAQPIMVFTSYDFFTSIGAIIEARIAGARVLNMSYGAGVPAALFFTVIPFEIATAAASLSMVLFASAGNSNTNVDAEDCFIVCWEETWWTPCENAGVFCVGGLAQNSKSRAGNSSYGNKSVDIFAPYSVIVGPDPARGPGAHQVNGTSFSAPYAAGVAALIMAANPSLSPNQVRNILISTAHSSPDSRVGRYVNAHAAVSQALGALILIESPGSGASLLGGYPVTFQSFVHEAGRGTPTIQWTSSLNGNLGTGATVTYSGLNFGTHTIRARATFPDSTILEDSINIIIVNNPPTVTITSPTNGASFLQGQPVLLAAASSDINEPGNTLRDSQMSWYVDNVLVGTGHSRTIAAGTLSLGSRVIRVTGTDGVLSDSKTVTITVNPNPPDLPPDQVTITSPAPNSIVGSVEYDSGGYYVEILMEGSASDPEDGVLTGTSLEWYVSLNSGSPTLVGTGSSITRKYYIGAGETIWDVTLTARDSANNTTSVTHRTSIYLLL